VDAEEQYTLFTAPMQERAAYRLAVPVCCLCGRNDAHALELVNGQYRPFCSACLCAHPPGELAVLLKE